MTANIEEWLDEILANYIGRVETYSQVHKGIPEHITHDREYARNVTTRSILTYISDHYVKREDVEKIIEVIGAPLKIWKEPVAALNGYKMKHRKDQIIRNCVNPELGLHILNELRGKK